MRAIFELFAKLLRERLVAKVATTEDSVRYTFFFALLSGGVFHHTELILEHPHPVIERKQIDLVVVPRGNRPSSAFEFKYDRTIPSNRNLNTTNRAGHVFYDLIRLAHIPQSTAAIKYFVYLTNSQMATYFQNPKNRLADLFDLEPGRSFQVDTVFFYASPPSFRDTIRCPFIPFDVVGLLARNLGGGHSLRVYEVKAR